MYAMPEGFPPAPPASPLEPDGPNPEIGTVRIGSSDFYRWMRSTIPT